MKIQEIEAQLQKYALKISTPFCYSCYQEAPTGTCRSCRSDDNMRLLQDVGVEYGTEWIVDHILEKNLTSTDIDEIFEQMIYSCYDSKTQIGFMELDTVFVMKNSDPICWDIAKQEYIDSLIEDELIFLSNKGNYYCVYDIEAFLNKNLENVSS